jgi:hypothetical protein
MWIADYRPVIVMTHGDELSEDDRLAARIYLGNMLRVSPVDHIFDIAGLCVHVKDIKFYNACILSSAHL